MASAKVAKYIRRYEVGCFYCENKGYAFTSQAEGSDMCRMHRTSHNMMKEVFETITPRTKQPRYRYFEHRGWMYCWTTERMGDGKFRAFIYKPVKDGHELVKEISFAQRQKAKARALRWYNTAKLRASGRLPASALA